MTINKIGSNISIALNDDLLPSAEGGVSLSDAEKWKLPTEQAFQIQDSLSISKDARAEKEKALLDELKRIDREVQQHEAAHQAAAGELFRGKSFTYKIGPDGQRYAVAGDVQIDTSAISGNPKATIAKMQKIRRAALSPGDPSAQDMRVAAAAMKIEIDARQELQKQSLSVSVQQSPKIKLPFPQEGISSENEGFSSSGKVPPSVNEVTNYDSGNSQKSISLNVSMHISSLYDRQNLSSPESKLIDVSI